VDDPWESTVSKRYLLPTSPHFRGHASFIRDVRLVTLARALRRRGPGAEALVPLRQAARRIHRPQDLLPLAAEHLVEARWSSIDRQALALPRTDDPQGSELLAEVAEWLQEGFPRKALGCLRARAGLLPEVLARALRGVARSDIGKPGAVSDLTAALEAAPEEAPSTWRDHLELERIRAGLTLGLLRESGDWLEALTARLAARPRPDPWRRRALDQERARWHLLRGEADAAAAVLQGIPSYHGCPGSGGLDAEATGLAVAVAIAQGRRRGVEAWLELRGSWSLDPIDHRSWALPPPCLHQLPKRSNSYWRREVVELLAARALARLALGAGSRNPDEDREVLAEVHAARGLSSRLGRELGWCSSDAAPLAHLARPLPRARRRPPPLVDTTRVEPLRKLLGKRRLTPVEANQVIELLGLRILEGTRRDEATGLPATVRDHAGQLLDLLPAASSGGPAYLTRAPWTWERFLAAGGEPSAEQGHVCLRPGPACGLDAAQVAAVLPPEFRVPTRTELAEAPGPDRAVAWEDLGLPVAAWAGHYGPHRGLRWTPDLRVLRPLLPLGPALDRRAGRARRRRTWSLGPPRVDIRTAFA
jgi:hypothetical protein